MSKAKAAVRAIWPVAIVGFALAVNAAWIVAIGYAVFKSAARRGRVGSPAAGQ